MNYLKTFKIFTFKGIDLKINWSFQIFILVLFIMFFLIGLGNGILYGLISSLLIIFCVLFSYFFVVIHEYGHALSALYLGYETKDISLYPMAGIASISGEWHKNPVHEFFITICGPITNLLMAAISFLFLKLYQSDSFQYLIFNFIFKINITLFIFNLIPVYPMDGGRIFRSIIGFIFKDWWIGMIWATRCSFIFGLFAIPLGFYFENPIIGFIVCFIGLYVAQFEMSYLKNLREIEKIEEEKFSLLFNLLQDLSLNLYKNDQKSQKEFMEIMIKFNEFLIKFANWSVRENISSEDFKKMIVYIFSEIKDIEKKSFYFDKSTFDEESLFIEIYKSFKLSN